MLRRRKKKRNFNKLVDLLRKVFLFVWFVFSVRKLREERGNNIFFQLFHYLNTTLQLYVG